MQQNKKSLCVLILAAGKGTRMHSKTSKVLQLLLEEPLLYYPLNSVRSAGIESAAVVLGFSGESVEAWLKKEFEETNIIWQREQLGTGHAAKLAQDWWKNYETVMVLPGDTPLITSETLKIFAELHTSNKNMCSFLSFDMDDPAGYGRVIRNGSSLKVVEHKDASEEERMCREVNSGMYIFNTEALSSVIDDIKCANSQKEYYLPDALALIQERGGRVDAVKAQCASEFLGVNDPRQLAEAAAIMRARITDKFMRSGVRCSDPLTTWIGPKVTMGEDIMLEPNVQLWGRTSVGSGSRIGSFSVLRDTDVEEDVTVVGSVRANNSRIGRGSSVGPFVFMRENTHLTENVHVGRFVEIKKSTVEDGSKVPHLSYIGDAHIGKKTNIGAGTITCNYDGVKKNKTLIGDNCFIGSDTMLVAPLVLGDNVTTAAGSTITNDIPEGALGVGRARQINIDNWYSRTKKIKGGN